MSAARSTFVSLVLAALGLASLGCGATVRSSLRDADKTGTPPANLVVVYDDHSAGFGGERVELSADGVLTLQRFRPAIGGEPVVAETVQGQLALELRRELVALLVEIEAWSQRDMPETSINDARATLELRVGSERSSIWEWADDLDANQRLSRVERLLMRFAADLETGVAGTSGGERPVGEGELPPEGERDPSDERAVEGVAPVRITDQSRPRR